MFYNLTNIPAGIYKCPTRWYEFWKNAGWLEIEKNRDETTISWRSHKYHHNVREGNCKIITLDKDGNVLFYYKTYLSLHLVWCHWERKIGKYYYEALEVGQWMENQFQQINKDHE